MSDTVRYRTFAAWAGAAVAGGALVLVLALLLGGGAPQPPPPGLAGTGRVPVWVGDVAAYVSLVVGVLAVGLGALATRWFGHDEMRPTAAALAAAWAAVTVLQIGVRAWELRGQAGALDGPHGTALLIQLVLAVVATAGWALGADGPGGSLALPAALAALLPVVLSGHPRSADQPWVAGVSMSVHVLAAALWVGGLAALAWLAVRTPDWAGSLARYSVLALGCACGVAASGVVAASGRIGPTDLFTSRYGAVVALKIVVLLALAAAGWLQRRYVVPRLGSSHRSFLAVALFELTTMAIAFGLAAALVDTPPPA